MGYDVRYLQYILHETSKILKGRNQKSQKEIGRSIGTYSIAIKWLAAFKSRVNYFIVKKSRSQEVMSSDEGIPESQESSILSYSSSTISRILEENGTRMHS